MTRLRPTTIAGYIRYAPPAGRPHLRRLHAIVAQIAPDARQVIKWGAPHFVEPRFLFAFSAATHHCNFAPTAAALKTFRQELAPCRTTKNFLQLPYAEPLPEALIRKIAKHRLRVVRERGDDSFW
jgi:uncharacterized protein YdhG (YjbR/CyaY superfamily)